MVALVVVTMFLPLIMADAFLGGPSTTFVSRRQTSPSISFLIRGGATTAADSQEDIEIESSEDEAEDEESEDEEEEEEEGLDAKLVKSAQTKAATVKTKIAKAAVKAAIATTVQPKKSSSSSSTKSLLKMLHIPYIIRACLNPLTVIKMTRAYFGSLVQLDYLNDNDSSKDLRSALQEKAKSSGGGGGTSPRGKRKFKPGKAKTLSDLPVLNT